MTGFRVALGGAQQRFEIMPDICMLGKVIGGGMPVGAYGGKAEIMDVISPVGSVYQAGTLSGNPIAMASGIATLECLRETNPYAALESKTRRLTQGLCAAAAKADLPHTLAECGSMFTLFFNPEKVTSYAISAKNDTARFGRYFQGMLDRGVYLPCSQFEANFTSVMLTDEDIVHIIQAAEDVLQEIG